MKCLYLYFVTVTVISATVPQDLCETCIPTQDCPLFGNLNITDQLKWMELFPCGPRPNNNAFEVPAGFASAAKGDYVCCSFNVWGVEQIDLPSERGPKAWSDLQSHASNDNNVNNKEPMKSTTNTPTTKKSGNIGSENRIRFDDSSPTGGTVWYPDRTQNYDNTDYWLNHPENNEFNNGTTNWNDRPGREQNVESTQRPFENISKPPINEAPKNGVTQPANNYPANIIIPPVQFDPFPPTTNDYAGDIRQPIQTPGNQVRPPNQYQPPENQVRPPNQYVPPGNQVRPPNQYEPPRNQVIPPNQYVPPGSQVRPPNQYKPPGNQVMPPNQYVPPGNQVRPPNQYVPPGNQVRPPNQYVPPGNQVMPPNQYVPPGNQVMPPNQYVPPGNQAMPPYQYVSPGNQAKPPNQYDPPWNEDRQPIRYNPSGNETRPPFSNNRPENVRPPNQYETPGNQGRLSYQYNPPRNDNIPPMQYDPPGNRPITNIPPQGNVRPPFQNNPPNYGTMPSNQYDPPRTDFRPPYGNNPMQYELPGYVGRPPHQYEPPRNGGGSGPPFSNEPPGNIVRPPRQYDPRENENFPYIPNNPGNGARPPFQYDPPMNEGRPPFENYPPDNIGRLPFERPGNQGSQPNQFNPAWNDNNYGPIYRDDTARQPNQNYFPGNSGNPNLYLPPGNMARPPTIYPPENNNYVTTPPFVNNPWQPPYNDYYQGNGRINDNDYYNNNNGSPYTTMRQEIFEGNYGGGQCSLTSFPPNPQSECCGRQLSEDDRIAGWNNRPNTNQWGTQRPRSGPVWRNRRQISENENDGNVTVENRISGGHATELYQYPWTVLLLTTFDYGNRDAAFNCGGGLLSAKYVLTAGHCVYDKNGSVKSVQVYLAEYDKNSFPMDCKSTGYGRRCIENIVMYVEEIITHPQYDNENLVNDIAMLRLRGSAPYTEYIRPICLPSINIDEPQFANLPLEVAGWGRVGPYSSNIKQSTVLHLVNHNECKRFYPQLTSKHLCAAGKRGEDTCKGDSGGPLMVLYRGKYFVTGIVSGKRSDSPCGTTVPSLYTNVYHYVDWIRSNMRY